MHRTVLVLLAASVALVVAGSAFSGSAKKAQTLTGTVGPGFTITLKKGGKTVKSLKAGTYKFKISDKSSSHNFALKGKKSKVMTSVPFTGKKTVTLKLAKGKYTYYCQPHASTMKGSFTVK